MQIPSTTMLQQQMQARILTEKMADDADSFNNNATTTDASSDSH
jgi:hypothetical protein